MLHYTTMSRSSLNSTRKVAIALTLGGLGGSRASLGSCKPRLAISRARRRAAGMDRSTVIHAHVTAPLRHGSVAQHDFQLVVVLG